MKKFVIVMITLLVLFVFLMLNYLLWDKENLQKQSASDRVEQDYLRGQNKTLQTTVDEQEQQINSLQKDNDSYLNRIGALESQLQQTQSTRDSLNQQLVTKNQAVDDYKLLLSGTLRAVAQQWFEKITNQDYEGSFKMLEGDCLLFGGNYDLEAYTAYISAVKSIGFVQQSEEEAAVNPDFEVLEGRGGDYEIITIATVQTAITDEQKEKYKDMLEGVNRLQIAFRFNSDTKTWAIYSVLEANE